MMRRTLTVLVVCASCGGAEGQAPPSAARLADQIFSDPETCYVVKDDLGAVAFFASFEPGLSRIPERLDSIAFFAKRGTIPVLTWDGGVDLKPFDGRAGRGPTTPEEPRLRYATNVRAVDWGDDRSRWPWTATVTMEGTSHSCALRELITGIEQSRPVVLGDANFDDSFGYGNCPHCVASFLCGCLGLEDELEYCDSLPPPETLQNCAEVADWLFPPSAS